ncbi:MAG TPA: PTS sugar transporter subunit IIA [Desulfomonilaceae bacterium]|nr:PTS sugar transporter subunit IIA [Desulfomonilaceae bacterium]
MDTLLDALQEGRLIELPDNNKEDALQFLAHILEAIPSIPTGTDVVRLVMAREASTSTALGKGWACPHAGVPCEEDLMCVIGWSPPGIDYGAQTAFPCRLSSCTWCLRTSEIITFERYPSWQRPLPPSPELKRCVPPLN